MRYGFVTCVELGRGCAEEILDVGGRLDWIGTLHDNRSTRKAGRANVDDLAERAGAELVKFRHINDEDAVAAIDNADLDWLFVIGWSQIAGEEVLTAPRRGVLGMHPTLLPEGRGRASIPWAIIKRLDETGVSLFQLDTGVDTGPVLAQHRVRIEPRETAATLYAKVAKAHRALIRTTWPDLESDRLDAIPQDETLATVWPGRRPEDGEIHPEASTVEEFDVMVRALTRPYPGAFVRKDGQKLTVWAGHPASDECDETAWLLECLDGHFCVHDGVWTGS